jgi:3-phosphoshikimate 1-carboxyvinyltransferase
MGAGITFGDNWIEACAPTSGRLRSIDIDCNHIPDAAMTLAVAALFADGVTVLRNIASWRVKETDRLEAMARELRKLGAKVEEGADFLRIEPISLHQARYAEIDTYDDHRMAMCFSLASFGTPLRINDSNCVGKTFPDYFEKFSTIVKD